jgi:hypothetical protein
MLGGVLFFVALGLVATSADDGIPYSGVPFHLHFNGTCMGEVGQPSRICKLSASSETEVNLLTAQGVQTERLALSGSSASLVLVPVAQGNSVVEQGTLTVGNNTLQFSGAGTHIALPAANSSWTRAVIGYAVEQGTGVWAGASGGVTGNVVVNRISGGAIAYEMVGWVAVPQKKKMTCDQLQILKIKQK